MGLLHPRAAGELRGGVGALILAGPTLGQINTGICVFEAPDEDTARQVMLDDPVIAGGYAKGELRPFKASFLRGRAAPG